jgi:hypothetical protein
MIRKLLLNRFEQTETAYQYVHESAGSSFSFCVVSHAALIVRRSAEISPSGVADLLTVK